MSAYKGRLRDYTLTQLRKRGVGVLLEEAVVKATSEGVHLKSGKIILATALFWAIAACHTSRHKLAVVAWISIVRGYGFQEHLYGAFILVHVFSTAFYNNMERCVTGCFLATFSLTLRPVKSQSYWTNSGCLGPFRCCIYRPGPVPRLLMRPEMAKDCSRTDLTR